MHSLCLFIIISLNFKKILDIFKKKDIIVLLQNFGELCNGSTTYSDSVCWGSNPYSPAKKSRSRKWAGFLLLTSYLFTLTSLKTPHRIFWK